MDPRDLLETYALPIAAFAAAVVLLGAWIAARRADRRRARRASSPSGPGAALALALDGDLDHARRILEERVRLGGPERVDALVGLVAVLKAQGRAPRARELVDQLAGRVQAPWLDALRVRLALDAGDVTAAAALVDERHELPIELALAALARADRWSDALRRYRATHSRRARDPALEAALAAGCAFELTRAHHTRSARRALKRALALDPDGVLPLVVAARLHPKETERHRSARKLAGRLPGFGPSPAANPRAEALAAALSLDESGQREAALGAVRDLLERHPRAWDARAVYTRWIIQSGTPEDWRHELAELVDLLTDDGAAPPVACRACGYTTPTPFAICPRCDAIGSVELVERRGDHAPDPGSSAVGTALSELLATPGAAEHEGPRRLTPAGHD